MNQVFSFPIKNKLKEELLHSTVSLFAEKDYLRDEQEQIAQIVGKPSELLARLNTFIIDPITSNARQY